jgi:uncharacterized protein YyaL (SSP411 family)
MNLLGKEKSLYLQQHKDNPVHWFPWGEAAFRQAREQNKPILVSIGYSTCHWCHVMEHESFEDSEVAELLNSRFVAIKVDREEKPDVDDFYMEALQMMTQRGGWPLNMFLSPDLKPFFGGTYFSKNSFIQLLTNIGDTWDSQPHVILEQSQNVFNHLQDGHALKTIPENPPPFRIRDSLKQFLTLELRQFDPIWGGFGSAPKFPRAHLLSALLRASLVDEDPAAKSSGLFAVNHTLKAMAWRGLRDHLRGGFHRYSTDESWLVPHFEKMLYDQSFLMTAYSEAWKAFRVPEFLDVCLQLREYLEAEMRLPEGGLAAAQDADSEGVEGKYFVWTAAELRTIFKDESAETLKQFFRLHSIEENGNWESANILAMPMDATWAEWTHPEMTRMREVLLKLRRSRVAPVRDSKMVVSWNAWMATALLKASMNIADKPDLSQQLRQSAERILIWILSVGGSDKNLPHIVYGLERQGEGYLEDYAAVIEALQWNAIVRMDSSLLKVARDYLDVAEKKFRKSDGGLRGRAATTHPELPWDQLDFDDNATPSALSTYLVAQLRQAQCEMNPEMRSRALSDLKPLHSILNHYPQIATYLLSGIRDCDSAVIHMPQSKESEWREFRIRSGHLAGLFPAFVDSKVRQFQACQQDACFAMGTVDEVMTQAEIQWNKF